MKKTRRTAQVGEMIRDALVEVFRRDLKGISVGMITIVDVEVSPDLKVARVYLSGYDVDGAKKTVKELQEAKGKVRHLLGQRIHLRQTPDLEFRLDTTSARAGRIEELLHEVIPAAPAADDAAEEPENEDDDDRHDA